MKAAIAALVIGSLMLAGVFGSVGAQGGTIWDGIYTDAQAQRGQAIYTQHCASCHGDDLTAGTEAPPLAGSAFLSGWKGNTVAALFEKMSTMMPQTDPGSLSPEQNAEILAYMLSAGKVPSGQTDLKGDAEALKQIRIGPKP